jgi:hypothetical protein
MAMVTKRLFVPSGDIYRFLTDGELASVKTPRAGGVVLEREDGKRIYLAGGYGDVQFKFEVYFIVPREDIDPYACQERRSIPLPKISKIEYLFRAEWEHPDAIEGSGVEGHEVLRDGGTPDDVPTDSLCAGIYLGML